MKKFIKTSTFLALMLFSMKAFGQLETSRPFGDSTIDASSYFSYLPDNGGKLTFEEVRDAKFIPFSEIFNEGKNAPGRFFWVKCTMQLAPDNAATTFYFYEIMYSQYELYRVEVNGDYTKTLGGLRKNEGKLPYDRYKIPFRLEDSLPVTFFIKMINIPNLKSEMQMKLHYYENPEENYIETIERESVAFTFQRYTIAILLFLFLVNLFTYFLTRKQDNPIFLFYALYLAMYTYFFQFCLELEYHYSNVLINHWMPFFGYFLHQNVLFCAYLLYGVFIIQFFKLKIDYPHLYPKMMVLIKIAAVILILNMIAGPLTGFSLNYQVFHNLLLLASVINGMYSLVLVYKVKHHLKWLFLGGLSIYFLGSVLGFVMHLFIDGSDYWSLAIISFINRLAVLGEVFCFTAALALRIYIAERKTGKEKVRRVQAELEKVQAKLEKAEAEWECARITKEKDEIDRNNRFNKGKISNLLTIYSSYSYELTLIRQRVEDLGNVNLTKSQKGKLQKGIRKSVAVMERMFSDIKDLMSSHQKMEYIKVDLVQLLEEIKDKYKCYSRKKGINISFHHPNLKELKVDVPKDEFLRIVYNLLENSLKYTGNYGDIKISLDSLDGYYFIEILDNGIGIPLVDQPYVYDLLFRGSNVKGQGYEGVGLGLTVVKHLVEILKGEITLESKEGESTKFRVSLPISNVEEDGVIVVEEELIKPERNPPTLGTSQNGQTVLIVSDRVNFCTIVKDCVKKLGYNYIIASNGFDGLNQARKHQPYLIVLENQLSMGKGSKLKGGMKMIQKLREGQNRNQFIPVLLITSRDDIKIKIECIEEVIHQMCRPIEPQILSAMIENLIYIGERNQINCTDIYDIDGELVLDEAQRRVYKILMENYTDRDYHREEFQRDLKKEDLSVEFSGKNVRELLLAFRLTKAQKLIKQNILIRDVITGVGFGDTSTQNFSRMYRKYFGHPPSHDRPKS